MEPKLEDKSNTVLPSFLFNNQHIKLKLKIICIFENEVIINNLFLVCLKQNNRMGNHIPPGIPPLLAKNWQPVPDHPNSFRNKLTSQYTHKHIINLQSALQIQSFKFRMKQTNMYICRVLFYHQYHESIYHVYTDKIHLQPNISRPDVWKLHKIRIMQSFWQLAQKYGFMKVCQQMIGADSNGHPKIWIHPDPVACKPWSICDNQYTMVTQILNILQNYQQRAANKQKKNIINSFMSNSQMQYKTFEQFIKTQTQLLNNYFSPAKNKPNKTSAIFQNNQEINSLAASTELVNPKKFKNNKTYAFESKNSVNNTIGLKDMQPRMSNEQYSKNNKVQKLNKQIICETSRLQESNKYIASRQNFIGASPNNYSKQRQNLSVGRPISYNNQPTFPKDKNSIYATEDLKTYSTINSLTPKRRQTQKFKTEKIQQLNTSIKRQQALKSKFDLKKKISSPLGSGLTVNPQAMDNSSFVSNNHTHDIVKNPLSKLLTQIPKPGIIAFTTPHYIGQNKTFQGLPNQNKIDHSIQNVLNTDKTRQKFNIAPRRQHKTYIMPNFLMKSFTETQRQQQQKQQTPKNPSTQRHQRDPYPFVYPQPRHPTTKSSQLKKKNINIISTKSIFTNSQQQLLQRPRKNTSSLQKQQLNQAQQAPNEQFQKKQYQNTKKTKNCYERENMFGKIYTQSELESEKDELDIIKQKVQEKKAKFAQLKTDARKILDDDF